MKVQNAYRISLVFILASLLSVAPVCFAATSTDKMTQKEMKQEVSEAAQAIKDYSVDQKDEAIKKVKALIDALDSRIESIKTSLDKKWDKMDQSARIKARATLRDIEKQRNLVAEWYGGLKHSSSGAWDQMKKGFSDSYTALRDSWKKAEKEFTGGK
jgi:hypothetical protein